MTNLSIQNLVGLLISKPSLHDYLALFNESLVYNCNTPKIKNIIKTSGDINEGTMTPGNV